MGPPIKQPPARDKGNMDIQDQSESEDELLYLKRKSLIVMEQNLISPCDLSPIQPKQMSEAETLKSGMNMEKLLMERVMLRKELKLRSMQERLLDQTRKLEEAEQRLEEFERLPGITQFMAMVRLGQQVRRQEEVLHNGPSAILFSCIRLSSVFPSSLFHLLPWCVQHGCLTLVAGVAQWLGDTAQNFDNECRERDRGTRGSRRQ